MNSPKSRSAGRNARRRAGLLGEIGRDPPSLANPEPIGHDPVALRVLLAQVLEQSPALADQHQQAPAGVMVLLVRLEMIRQTVDALGEQRDLHFGRPGVPIMCFELIDEASLLLDGQPHGRSSGVLPQSPRPQSSRFGSVGTGSSNRVDIKGDSVKATMTRRTCKGERLLRTAAVRGTWRGAPSRE